MALPPLIHLMHFMLVANSWILALDCLPLAPPVLVLSCPLLFSGFWVSSLILLRRAHSDRATDSSIARALVRMTWSVGLLPLIFSVWAMALYYYGDAQDQGHVAFYLMASMLGFVFCLAHLETPGLVPTVMANTLFVGFLLTRGQESAVMMAINVALIIVPVLIVVHKQKRDFGRMVTAQADAQAMIARLRQKEREQSRLLHMIDDMPVAVMTVEPDDLSINYLNGTSKRLIERIEHLLPIKAADMLGTPIDLFYADPELQHRLFTDPANLPHKARIQLGPEKIDLKITAVTDDEGAYVGPMLSWAIVTKEVEAENQILQLAHYDALTGLANRNSLHRELEARLATPDAQAALLFIDLDGFKRVNDTKGHHVGDLLLQQVAARLRLQCGAPGTVIGRLGGDEFGVLLSGNDMAQVQALAATLIAELGELYHLGETGQARIAASIGIALAPMHGDNAETLLMRSDIALHAAKAAGKGVACLFRPEMEESIHERAHMEARLRAALEAEEGLFVFYQPIVSVDTGKVTAREALIRWHDTERGWLPPAEFIPIAEESGLIDMLTGFVLRRACRDAAEWPESERVAVNISAAQLGKGTIAQVLCSALASAGLRPDRLEVEVTETALLGDEGDSIADLCALRALGVRLALDDFGTGYSSLAHLRAFPFDKIKIDGSFVRDAVTRPDCAAVVKAIADLGKRLGVAVVAEGVETQAHLDRALEEGCSEVQGYLYGYPRPSEADAPQVARLEAPAGGTGSAV